MAGKKLLVADDSLTIQKVIRLALSNEGYEIQTVSDGNDAIQQIAVFRPDLVLIDISLPGKSAFEVKQEINQHGDLSSTRFVLMSSAFEKVDEEQAGAARFDGRLTKPFDPAHLRHVLTQILSPGFAPSPASGTAMPSNDLPKTPDVPPPFDFSSEDELKPLEPEEFPTMAPAIENSGSLEIPNDLSDLDQIHIGNSNERFLDPLLPRENPDADIRHLTESTIRMSGLEDFQWSVDESAAKSDEPSLPPPPAMKDLGDSTFDLSGMNPAAEALANSPIPEAPPPTSAALSQPDVAPLTTGQMEELLRSQLQETLERMAQQILPEVAERIIKQEIHRMLQEQP